MSEEYDHEDLLHFQQRLDLYFEHKAKKLLPNCLTYSDGLFQGYRIQFAAKEVTYKKNGPIKLHADPVAGELDSVTVKFRRHKPDEDEAKAGIKPHWVHKVTVYGNKDNFPAAIKVLENPPKPKAKPGPKAKESVTPTTETPTEPVQPVA